MPTPKNKKELQSFLGIINYLSKCSLDMVEVCKPLRKLTSSKATWTWDASYQQWFKKAKMLIKVEMCMIFYDDNKLLYLETDASGIGLGAALLQLRDDTSCQTHMAPDNTILCPITFASKSLMGAEHRYSNIKCEALSILHGLEKFHHYCFGREVLMITDHKPLVSMFKKDVATLSQCIQCILLKIHQYGVQIIYKPGPEIFIADWLSRHNHTEEKDKPIKGMDIHMDAIQATTEMPECVSVAEIQQVSSINNHLQQLKGIIITGWWDSRDELDDDLQPYSSYRDELAVIDGIILKGKCIIIPNSLKEQVLNQLHKSHGHRNNKATGLWMCILVQHKCRYWKIHKTMCDMPSFSANTASGKNNSSWYTPPTMGGSLGWCVPLQ